MKTGAPPSRPLLALPFIGAALTLIAFYLVGAVYANGFALDLGSLNFPSPRYRVFVTFYTLLGGLTAASLALGTARYLGAQRRADAFTAQW